MSSNEIRKLTDMGFTEEQAVNALQSAGNDVERAIAYLFEDPIEIDPPEEKTSGAAHTNTVDILNPQDIPDFSKFEDTQDHFKEIQFDHQENKPDQREGSNQISSSSSSDYQQEIVDTVYDHKDRFLKVANEPSTILPIRRGRFENYLIPIIQILSQVKSFEELWLKNKDFKFHDTEDWYLPSSKSEVVIPEDIEESKVENYRLAAELARSLGYLHGGSNRSFISGKNLFSSIPDESSFKGRIEEFEELIERIYNVFRKGYEAISPDDDKFKRLFKSLIQSVQDEVENKLTVLSIDNEARSSTIYESLNSMFWTDEDNIGDINFVEIAPVLTIPLFGDMDYSTAPPLTLHEYFYPQIYSSQYSSIVADMNSRRRVVAEERSEISRQIMSSNSFEGKRIRVFLQNSISYLKKTDAEASEDLTKLESQLTQERSDLTQRLQSLSESYVKLAITQYDNILEEITKTKGVTIKPYILTGVIFSDLEYLYKDTYRKDEEDWIYFNASLYRDEITDYSLESMNFESVQQIVHQYSTNRTKSIVLFYVNSEHVNDSTHTDLPEELKRAIYKDNEVLSNQSKEDTIDSLDMRNTESSASAETNSANLIDL